MELLPILSTIILVGTLATLILAVAAYVLYKIRERQGRSAPAPPPAAPPQPLLLTAPAGHAGPTQAEQLQELLRLAAAGLQQQQAAALPPPEAPEATPPAGWSAPAASPHTTPTSAPPEPVWEEATFEDVTPLRARDLAGFFDEEATDTAPHSSASPPLAPRTSPVERKDDHASPRPARQTARAVTPPASRPVPLPRTPPSSTRPPAAPLPAATPSGDGAASDDDFQELLRLADELDTLLDAPETPSARNDAASRD